MARVALGFRDHSGWAIMVALAGTPDSPEVLLRERVELLTDPALPGQVYHAAVDLPLDEAAELIAAVERSAREAARTVLDGAAASLDGHEIEGVALGLDKGVLPDDLAAILGNHTSLHVGEGELYREALADAAAARGLPTVRHDFRTLARTAGDRATGLVGGLRAEFGAPWARDHKDAALAAWLTLHR